MKECDIVQDLLIGYNDGTLKEESKKMVDKHLKNCEVCQIILKEIQSDNTDIGEKEKIDYLKKIRRKSIIKSIIIAIIIILIIGLVIFLNKFFKINFLCNKAEEKLSSNNIYIQRIQMLGNYGTSVTKSYFKDGNYKSINEEYSDDGVEIKNITYTKLGSDEKIIIYEDKKKAVIERGEVTKLFNSESILKGSSFIPNDLRFKLGAVIYNSIDTDTYEIGREYYVFRNQFENNNRAESWIDKDTGLVLKKINRDANKIYYPETEIVKEVYDNIEEYKYEFDIVKDEDVTIPDLSNYEIEYIDTGSLDDLINKK